MTVFNKTKTVEQYEDKALFLGEDKGLLNTIHKHFPKIWKCYKTVKSLEWSEDEFTFFRCINEFKTCAPDVRDMMIKTLAWQWEADSIAATSPICLVAPFNPCIEVWEAEVAITANEIVHANTYSEIVRMSFENPSEVLGSILADQEAMDRVSVIEAYLSEFAAFSPDYKQNPEKYTRKEAIKNLMKFYYAMLLLERIQFMASFAITFTICKSGLFNAIGQAVKKIAQDELEVHVGYRKEVFTELRNMDNESFGGEIFAEIKADLKSMLLSVISTEIEWTKYLFAGRSLVGINETMVIDWILFNAKDVVKFTEFGYDEFGEYSFPAKNPIPHLEDWFNMNSSQSSPQEQQVAAYKMNSVIRDDSDIVFEF